MAARSKPRSLPDAPAAGWARAPVRLISRRLGLVAALFCALLTLGGCLIPVEGDITSLRPTTPAETPLTAGEKVVVLGEQPNWDDRYPADCVRDELQRYLADQSVIDPVAFRKAVGLGFKSIDTASESLTTQLSDLAENREAAASIKKLNVRFAVTVSSQYFSRGSYYAGIGGGESGTSIRADIVDVVTGSVVGPASLIVAGNNVAIVVVGAFVYTEGPACRHLAALIVSAVTGTPPAQLDPDIGSAIAAAEAERKEREQTIQWCRDQFPTYPCSEAREFLEICHAAVSGDPVSMFRLANWFKKGIYPVQQDPVAAYVWFGRAKVAGNLGTYAGATDYSMERLRRTLTVGQLTEAENRLLSSNVNLTECAVELETAEGS